MQHMHTYIHNIHTHTHAYRSKHIGHFGAVKMDFFHFFFSLEYNVRKSFNSKPPGFGLTANTSNNMNRN